MKKYLNTEMGRLRFLGFLEGGSLIFLVFIAVPMKYLMENPIFVEVIGPIHGVLFIGFILYTIRTSIAANWSFFKRTIWVLLSSFIPFGTIIVDKWMLQKLHAEELLAR